jgi:presequence protease
MDPFEPLKYERPLQQLKARLAAEGSKAILSPLIEKFILKNVHRVTIEMRVSRKLVTSGMAAFSL